MEHKVQCRAFASNIPHNTVSSQGMVTFNVCIYGIIKKFFDIIFR